MSNFLRISFLLIFLNSIVGATCQYKYEEKGSAIISTVKTVIDYTEKQQEKAIVNDTFFNKGWCTDHNLWVTAKANGSKVDISLKADDARCGYQVRTIGSVSFPFNVKTISRVKYDSTTSGAGCYTINIRDQIVSGGGSSLYLGEISECSASSAQYPTVDFKVKEIEVLGDFVCPDGYIDNGNNCKKTIQYTFIDYKCDINDKNTQNFGWELVSPVINDGSKIDNDLTSVNNLSNPVYSHSAQPQCKRKYQECTIDCDSPLVLDEATGKCVISYEDMCIEKGMIYNSSTKLCEKENQCGNVNAYKDSNSSYCMMVPKCDVVNGVCGELPNKLCSNTDFAYYLSSNICEKNTACITDQYVLNDGRCGGEPFCNDNDTETIEDCINTINLSKSCAPDSRSGNLCYASNGVSSNSIDYHRPLLKASATGSFKEAGYGNKLGILCTNTSDKCQFRLTNIYTENDGKQLCFKDAQGVESCIEISGDCSFSGSIDYPNGIKQLKIEDGNKIVAYNLQDKTENIGSIHATCTLSGKVGSFDGVYVSSDITSIKADGLDIKFWDAYQRGFIGVISMLPTIPQKDLDDGYVYEDANVYTLLNKGFTGFYSEDDSVVYGVYNGFISKSDCQDLIDETAFYIPQATTIAEEDILKGLSFKSGNNYNFNDGDLTNGSCVIKSNSSQSFTKQDYSVKNTFIDESSSIFVCSPFSCLNHYCQYSQCPTGYSPTLYDQSYFDVIVAQDFPDASSAEVCNTDLCDSNKPYFKYCGNSYGCEIKPNIYQQSDGTCVEVSCRSNEQLNPNTGKCISYGCKNSIERSGKCYRSLY